MRVTEWFGVVSLLAATVTTPAEAQNFPPRARVSVSSIEALVGEPVTLDARSSIDPDDGPMPLAFRWELGDGTVADGPLVTHAYAAAGLYPIRVSVSDGDSSSVAGVEVGVVAAPTERSARASSTIALTPQALFVANDDSGSVSRVELTDRSVLERPVCTAPSALSIAGGVLNVGCSESGELVRLDAESLDVLARMEVGLGPRGLISLADGRTLVALESERALAIVDVAGAVERVPLSLAPHAIAVDGDGVEAWITSLRSSGDVGRVVRVDLLSLSRAEALLAVDPGPDTSTSGRGVPNVLSAIAIDPRAETVWVGGIKQNTGRGVFVSGEPLDTRSRLRGVLLPVDRATGTDLANQRLDTNDADAVSGIAFSPRGRFAYLTHQGAGRLSVYDLLRFADADPASTDAFPFEARIDIGHAPGAVVLNAAGDRAYVHARLSREVVVLDLSDPRAPVQTARIAVTDEALPSLIAEGKRRFHRSRAPVHSDQSYIACASCHPGGAHDGQTWDFTQFGEGLRNTIDLRGRAGLAHGPLHWSANFDEVQDFENDIVASFGGTGLAADGDPPHPPLGEPNGGRSRALDALAAYVSSLDRFPRSPFRSVDGSLTAAALRGKAIFHDARSRCTTCHVPPRFTDSALSGELHDVGTLGPGSGSRLGGPLDGLDTPTLLGLWDTAPYLHDGSAPTLGAVLEWNGDDRHGQTSLLSAAERSDLVAFLLSLDGSDDELPTAAMDDGGTGAAPPVAGGGCTGCAVQQQPRPTLFGALLWLLGWRRRRERILTYTETEAGACGGSPRVGRVDS